MTLDNFNLDGLKLVDKDVFSEWELKICENDGSYSSDFQSITFDYLGHEVFVGFSLSIKGYYTYIPESYLQPAEGDTYITSVDVDVDSLMVDGDDVPFNNIRFDLEKMVQKILEDDYTLL